MVLLEGHVLCAGCMIQIRKEKAIEQITIHGPKLVCPYCAGHGFVDKYNWRVTQKTARKR